MKFNKFINSYTGTFLICFMQVFIVTWNMYHVVRHNFIFIFIISFFISFNWAFNVSIIKNSTTLKKVIYALGGAVGSTAATLLDYYFFKK